MNFDDHPNAKDLSRLRKLAVRMDSAFRLPVVGSIGWDAILGLVPVVGDVLAKAPAIFIIKEAHRLGIPTLVLAKMTANVAIDFAIGAVPLVGDLIDIGWRANTRNVDLVHRHIAKDPPPQEG